MDTSHIIAHIISAVAVAIPYLLSLIMALIGVFSWQAYYSLFIIAGLAVNTFCLSFPDAQKVRISVLGTPGGNRTHD